MSNVTSEEAEELLAEFVHLREKCKTSKSKKVHLQYKKCMENCAQKFDYIVKNKVRRYKNFSNYEDLLQDGRVALMLALDSYKVGRGSWFWWANQYVRTKISREANKHSTIKIPIEQTKNILPYKVSQIPVMVDFSNSAFDSFEESESSVAVRDAIAKLPGIQRKVIEMYFEIETRSGNTSIAKICNELDISRKDCQKILANAKESLKQSLKSMEG